MDTRVTCHVYSNKEMFSSYRATNNGEQHCVANSATSKVEVQAKVVFKITCGKELTLK